MYVCGSTINKHYLLAIRTFKDFVYDEFFFKILEI